MVELLDSINLDAQCIKEITVNYKNKTAEKIDTAKLRESSAILKFQFSDSKGQDYAEFILDNLEEVLKAERNKYYKQVQNKFKDATIVDDNYEIVEQWDEGEVKHHA